MEKCIICGERCGEGRTLFRFPRDPKRSAIWRSRLRLSERDIRVSSRVCTDHFDSNVVEEFSPVRMELMNCRMQRRLKPGAVPSPLMRVKRRSTGKWRQERDSVWEKEMYLRQVYQQCSDTSTLVEPCDGDPLLETEVTLKETSSATTAAAPSGEVSFEESVTQTCTVSTQWDPEDFAADNKSAVDASVQWNEADFEENFAANNTDNKAFVIHYTLHSHV
eukprot:m.10358 g.10358  ORF g.10358 m.10358 type:complete len:220 (+) comp22210_c0_seq1:114-773(+)